MHSSEVNVGPADQTIIFLAGQTQAQIGVSVIDDGEPEETEEVHFQLTETSGKYHSSCKTSNKFATETFHVTAFYMHYFFISLFATSKQ